MATGGDVKLTDSEIEDLAQNIIAKNMTTIAMKDLGIGYETTENLKLIKGKDYIGYNRDLLVLWRNKNPGINQVQRLADIFYAAAEDGGLVDPHKIEKILKVPNLKNSAEPKTTTEETITEVEFLAIAEKMKPHTMRRMKLEPFPWLRDYFVDMGKFYTELTLDEIENTISGEISKILASYEHMFEHQFSSKIEGRVEIRSKKVPSRNKILMKGDPGMGKSTLGKKMGFDWARGIFKKYSVVLFVALKLVKPGEAIENVILQQHSELQGLEVSPGKVRDMLQMFGDRCLLILDGLDEHGLGKNQDVLRIIRDEKLLDCGVIVSSRPHSVKEIEQYFPSIIRVDGFTRKNAKAFVSNFFIDETKITQIMEFKPSDLREHFPVQKCPILLSFLCLLVKEDEIDLSSTFNSTVGDLYLRMVQCLYKKFTIRKGVKFENSEFLQVMKSVGALALKTLLSNNPLLQKSDVLEITGDFAYEYGFFAGHEDFRLCTDPTADVYVTYAHRSIEEFFGSFGFIQALDNGKSVDDILGSDCEEPIFMENPLVLNFCLYLMSLQDLGFVHSYDKLVSYVANSIDHEQFDPLVIAEIYSAVDIIKSIKQSNRLELSFFRHALEKCQNIKAIHVVQGWVSLDGLLLELADWIFSSLNRDLLDKLTLVLIGEYLLCEDSPENTLTISIKIHDMVCSELLDILLNRYGLHSRNLQVYLTEEITSSNYDISTVISEHIKELDLRSDGECTLTSGGIPYCPLFTCLKLTGFDIDPSVPAAFTKAVNDGKLPNLRCIELCNMTMNAVNWPEVPEFCYQPGHLTNPSDMQQLLSKLTCLILTRFAGNIVRFFTKQLINLSVIKLVGINDEQCFSNLAKVLKQGKVPNLTKLFVSGIESFQINKRGLSPRVVFNLHDLSLREFQPKHTPHLETVCLHWFTVDVVELSHKLSFFQLRELDIRNNKWIGGCLSVLFKNSFPTLQSLMLGGTTLHEKDIENLALASEEGRLPNLRQLIIHNGPDNPHVVRLFTGREKWNQLLTLRIDDCNVFGLRFECLASLESLDLRRPGVRNFTIERCWPHLETITSDSEALLSAVLKGVKNGLLPALKTVKCIDDISMSLVFRFHEANITYIAHT